VRPPIIGGMGPEGEAPRAPRLGVVLLDCRHYQAPYGRFEPSDQTGLGTLNAGFYECPATWPVPTSFAVAEGATPSATIEGEDRAVTGLLGALARLAPETDLIVTDCGFFWRARTLPEVVLQGTTLVSSLDLLDLAARLAPGPIGVLTYSERSLKRLLAEHPLLGRLRIVGLSDQPQWSHFASEDFAVRPAWTREGIRDELLGLAAQELAGGRLRDAQVLVLECTCFPQFREDLRRLTSLPILDGATLARSALR
jgi:hypothetical protein